MKNYFPKVGSNLVNLLKLHLEFQLLIKVVQPQKILPSPRELSCNLTLQWKTLALSFQGVESLCEVKMKLLAGGFQAFSELFCLAYPI